jgi:DNA-binding response OmpR family regulator/REP element-mobilizing transposase RayT
MAVSILIATPSQAFGELIRETLLEADEYQPVLATNLNGLMQRANHKHFDLLILDLDMAGVALSELWQAIQKSTPEIRLAAISWQGAEDSAILNSIKPDGLLTKPFYAPDLVKAIHNILSTGIKETAKQPPETQENEPDHEGIGLVSASTSPQLDEIAAESAAQPAKSGAVPWLEDVTRAAQHLTRLSLEADALAALITRNEQLWAYAGQLPQSAAEELAQAVLRDWSDRLQTGSSDLVCFVRLKSTDEEYMLYATRLEEQMALALAFDAQTPFSRIRTQANHLARALSAPPNGETPDTHVSTSMPANNLSQTHNGLEEAFEDEEDNWTVEFPIEPLFPLESVPPPTPDKSNFNHLPNEVTQASSEDHMPDEDLGSVNDLYTTVPNRLLSQHSLDMAAEHIADPREMDSDSNGIFSLQYACTLIPRLPNHHLTGKLATHLSEWMRQLNLAYGWRLEYLAVRPSYLCWVSNVFPDTSPASLITKIRSQTSARIFKEFPHLYQENPSGDFWASTFLILTASQPPPGRLLKEFIEQTRREQGMRPGQ